MKIKWFRGWPFGLYERWVLGDIIVTDQNKAWSDRRVSELYQIIRVTRDRVIRQEALSLLGALARTGSQDAKWALDDIKKREA